MERKMKFSNFRLLVLGLFLLGLALRPAGAQNQWIDSILPPDHLLENLPWMGDDGKIESKGLFDFEDIRGNGQKDLILIYRQSVPVNELDKPHNQTLIVCFYDSKQQKYIKNFEDEGGTIQWVRFLNGADKKSLNLVLQRDDLKGNQVLKGFAFLNGGMKQVLEAMAPQVYAKFLTGFAGTDIVCSSKEMPKDRTDGEHVFSWDEGKSQYAEGKSTGTAGWTGASISIPVVVVEKKPVETVPKTFAPSVTTEKPIVKASHPSKNGWWDEPLDKDAGATKLRTELVPALIKKGDVAGLGKKAKAFFEVLDKKGVSQKEIASIRSGYYAAVASAVLDNGDAKGAKYYLKLALTLQADNPDALLLKEKIK